MTTEEAFAPIIRLQADDTTAFLRAARSGNLEKVIEFLDTDLDINTANSNGLNALHLASKDGHVEIVTELLKRSAKVDASTKKGNTALHIASLAGQAEIVNILIQYGAAVNIQSQNGFTPLYMAAQENHDQVVKLLLSNGANQSLATEDGFTPLAVAMQQGHDKVVSVLLENDSKGKVRLPALHIAAKKDDCKAADLLLQNDHKPDVTSKSGFTPLHIAAHYGNEEIARLLIKRGADVNYIAKHNISPLHVAAKWGKNNMVKVLLENSAQIDAKTRDGLTPLHCAARSGHEQVITTLLEHSAPISARTKNGLAPLHMASQGDHVDAARVLLYHRAPVDEVTIDYLTSLHVAAHCGHVRVAKLLLDRKADPNARALNGFTPLHIACKKNRIKVVELLLKHGASIESTTESGLTPLHVASFMGCMNIVIFLLQHEANPDVPTVRGETPLHLAARANQTDIIRILLRNGAKVDARAREQQTPLHIASRLGNIVIVMLLLQHGAAVDTTTKNMYTALHIAAKEGQEEVTSILVDNNASLKATTKNGFTPLHIAAKYGNMSVAKILLQRSSKLDAQGKNDISPLHLACHYDHPNVANLLLEKGASPHLVSQNGHTPLHIAARKNQMEIASTLLERGANANAESKAGFTPLHLSAQKGHYDMTNLLIEHGADPNHKSKNGLSALHLCAQEDFIRVASILVKNGANAETETETGYRPIHVAAHFGHLSMIRFLLKHNADINVKNNQNYTPLHQAAQQGHAHIVTALLEGNASHKARTNDGLTALNIAQKLGYISVTEVLKGLSYDTLSPDNKNWDEKYKVIAPESLQETNFMSDSDDEGGSDALISEQPYLYLTADLMKSLRDDSLPIDVTRDDPVHRQVTKEGLQEFTQSNNYCLAENFDTDGFNLGRLHFRSFLVSFLVDARGGAMKGCRHSGVRIIVPPRRATMPIRVTCRLIKPNKVANLPPLMEGEALATRIIEMGPIGATFLGPVLIDIPHFASIRGKEREIIILRSENGETWKEHDNSVDNDDTLLNTPYDPQMSATHSGRITRIITTDFPQYFATVTRIKQEVHVIGAEGGILISSVANHVQAVFPPGALTKKIKVGLQAHVIPAELTAKLLGNCVAVSPIITIEPRRRKFHKPITLTIPVPQAANKGMINQYGGETPTLRLLCSIAGGTSESQWEDVTGSTPLTFMNDKVSFTTTVSARFWLMDCRNIGAVSRMATELYEESLYVPYIINFVIYSKRMDALEATLRILCMTDGKEGMHTLERQEEFVEIVKSRDVEALDGKDLYIEFSGNLVPVTKSGVQLKFTFKAFRQNRLSFHVKVKDPLLDPVARMLFMREPKVAKGEPPQQPICVLNIVLPEISAKIEAPKKLKEYEDSNIINQKIDSYKSKYEMEGKEKKDELKEISPSEKKFIKDTLQKERTDAVTIHESLAQKAACPLESVDASYPSKVVGDEQELSSTSERQTYKEKRKFWEDISKKRESYQRSESDASRTSELTLNGSDSQYMQNVGTEDTGATSEMEMEKSETMEDLNVPDISECSVAEKAHYFEEQIQKEITKVVPKLHQQVSLKTEKEKSTKGKIGDKERDDDDERYITESHEAKKIEKTHEIISETKDQKVEERKEVEKSVLEDENEKDKVEKMYKDVSEDRIKSKSDVLKHIVSEDIVTEKTDEPEKLKEDVEKVDHSIRVQSTEEIAKKEKDESQKIQKSKEQMVEHKEQSSIRTEEKSFERWEVLEESSTLVKDQRRESKVEDVTEQQRSVSDTIQKQKEGKTHVGDKEEIQRAQEVAKEIVTEVKVEKEIVKDAKEKQEEVTGPVTEVKVEKEIIKDVKKKQEEVKEVVSEIKIEKEIVQDVKKKQDEPKKPVTEVKVEKEIIKDVKKKQEEVKELVSEVKIEKEITKDVKKEEVKEPVTEIKVEKEIIKDVKKKQEELKGLVTEIKIEKEIIKDAKSKQEEVKGPVTEVKIEKEIIKDAESKQEEVKGPVTEVKIEKEIIKDSKKKQEEPKGPDTEIKIEKEIIKDAKKKQEEVKEPVTEVKIEKEIKKDVKKKQVEVKELVSEVKIEKEIIKEAKKEEVKEPVTRIKIEKEIIKDVKKEVKEPVAEIKIEKEIIKEAKKEEVKEPVTEMKIEKEIIKDVKKEEVKEPVTEIKIEKEIKKDVKKKQVEVKELVSEVKIEKEIIKEAKKEEVKEPVTRIKIEKEIIKDVKKEVKEPVAEIKIEKEIIKEAKKEEVKEPVTEMKTEKEIIKDVKKEEVKEPVIETKIEKEITKDLKKEQEEVKELVTGVKVEKELLKDKEEMQKRIQRTREDVDDFVTRRSIEHEISRVAKGSPKVKPPDTDVSILKERAGGSRVQKGNTVTEMSSGRRIITEETTIIYKVQKDGTLVQEQVLKSVQIGEGATNSVGLLCGVSRDAITSSEMYETQSLENVKPEIISSADVSNEIQKFLEGKRKLEIETMGEVEHGTSLEILEKLPIVQGAITKEEAEVKKDDEETIVKEEPVTEVDTKHVKKESRIPVSTAKTDKDKVQKETKPKPEELKQIPSKPELAKDSSTELLDTVSPTGKKKEFESRIPKRVVDVKSTTEKQGQKDTHVKKESETYTITEKKLSEEVTSKLEEHLTTKSETQTFSKTFTDPQDAFEMFEDMDSMKNNFATVTSKVDHKSSSVLEKKEVISSEICSGTDKIITLEEKERVEKKKSSESQVKKESPTETVEEKKSKMEELDKTAIQKMSMNLTDTQEVIDATAAESRAETKKEVSFEKLSDEKGITTHEAGRSIIRESDAEVAIRIKKDISEATRDKDDIKIIEEDASGERVFKPVTDFDNVEKIVHGESRKETKESFEVSKFTPTEKITKEDSETKKPEKITQIESLEEAQRQKLNEIEARAIAETLIKSIESEIETKSAADLKTELLSKGYLEQIAREDAEFDHEKLADDLTRKFENIMKKSASRQADKIATDQSSAELPRLRSSMQDESYEKETTRDSISVSEDITKDEESSPPMSPSSISELINFEETIDVDTNELEDISKSVLSTQFDKQRSDKYGSQMESRDLHSEESFPRDKIASEISDIRVLEVLEPGVESQSRQDSVDMPSLEMDEHKISEQTSRGIPSLHESADTDSFERIVQERDITISPSTVSEDTNVDYSLVQEAAQKEHEAISTKRADSFEYESPPILSPKSKVSLEIKSVNWMIGEEKIEISETLQPSQIFNQELEAYESMRKKECLSSQDGSTDYDQESVTKSSEEVSVIESIKETCTDNGSAVQAVPAVPAVVKSIKFTVIPISEQDFESELVENKLDVSCQELVDTLQREYDAKTPNKEYVESIQQKVATEEVVESEKREEEPIKVEEKVAEDRASVTAEVDTKKSSVTVTRPEIELKLEKVKTTQDATESDGLKEWTEGYLSKIKPSSDEYKRHIEKSTDKHDKPGRFVTVPSDTCAFKIKKDDFSGVDLSARYAITVLDQVVKKEIAEVKESLEAARQDLIEELNENSETVIQIKDSPSEFQFKLQPESIPNDLPSLYKSSSPERDTEIVKSDSPIAESAPPYIVESKTHAEESASPGVVDTPIIVTRRETPVIETEIETENEKSEVETAIITVHEDTKDDEEGHPSPVPVSRSGSDIDNKDESSSLVLPCPILRRRHKSARASKRVASESEADVGSSSGDSSNYQSCDYEIGSGSRPSSSDIEALQSGCILSATASEYETAMMSIEHSTSSKQTSQEYHTAATTMSSRESMKSLTSLSSGHLGSIDSTSEFSETLVPSEGDAEEKEEMEDDFKSSFEEERTEQSDSSGSDIPIDESMDKIDSHIPYRMKRSSEMIFPQKEDEVEDEKSPTDGKGIDFATSTVTPTSGTLKSVDIMTSRVSEDGIQSVCTQVSSVQTALYVDKEIESKAVDPEMIETVLDAQIAEPDFLEQKYPATGPSNESSETSAQISSMQQASMSTSSTSIGSVTTVIGKEKSDRHSPDSDSFEIVDKPDIIDDFVVIEEVGREAKEFDSEGKSIRISSVPTVSSKNYDRDLENLLTDSKTDFQKTASHSSKNNELFDFESQESPPQASNDDQYSQSYSDEESKKWVEMLFHVDARVCGVEYDRGPLEDIKEEEVTDFEAGSSRFGSLGSQKESIGSVGSMRGSFGSTPDYDVLASKKYFVKTAEHDNVSLSSLQEFEHLESTVAAENSKKLQCGSHDSVNNGSLPKRYTASRSGHGDDVSLSSLKDFEGLEKACREAHLIELRAREEEDLLEHESPENRYKLENLTRARIDTSNVGSFNPSTSGSDDYEKRIKEIDEIIRIAQSNVERFDRQDDTTEDISQIEIMDAEKTGIQVPVQSASKQEEPKDVHIQKETNIMETSTDSLELEDNVDIKHHPLCRSSDSLEMKTTLDFPSLSSDSLNNVRDGKEAQSDMVGHASFRRISSDSLDMPLLEQQNVEGHERNSENDNSDGAPSDNSLEQRLETTETDVRSEKARTTPSTGT